MNKHCRGCIRYLKSCTGMSKAVCEKHKLRIPRTNADAIRAMSDGELAAFLERWALGDIDYSKTFCNLCGGQYDCHDDCLMDWLRKEVDE